MSIQDRAYAAAILIVLGICCIGAYVAVSGFINANPQGITLGLGGGTQTPTSESAVAIPSGTVAPPSSSPLPTEPPTRTPKGFVPSSTATTKRPPTLDLPTSSSIQVITSTPLASVQAVGCGYPFCGKIGKPEAAMAPTGRDCPSDYLWGAVYDKNGKGIPGWTIRFQQVGGGSDKVSTKGPPDSRLGGYDIVAAGGTWILQLYDPSGNSKSPPFQIKARQSYTGGTNCPTRVDFVEQ